jgi:pre-mRNA-splicing helicase BRR2
VFTVLYNSDDSVLVAHQPAAEPIGAEFAILRNHEKAVSRETNMQVVYIAPIEALAKERFGEFA